MTEETTVNLCSSCSKAEYHSATEWWCSEYRCYKRMPAEQCQDYVEKTVR